MRYRRIGYFYMGFIIIGISFIMDFGFNGVIL